MSDPIKREKARWIPYHASETYGFDPLDMGGDPVVCYVCPECGGEALLDKKGEIEQSDFCPHCGAMMKEKG